LFCGILPQAFIQGHAGWP